MATKFLNPDEIREIVYGGVDQLGLGAGSRVLGITPDKTRSFDATVVHHFIEACQAKGAHVDLLIANGTHEAMPDKDICEFLKLNAIPEAAGRIRIFNHSAEGEELEEYGLLDVATVTALSEGRITSEIPVTVNSRVSRYDASVVIGPVFPHEVIGMSGGWKYFFPGISGAHIINHTHWLGALVGIRDTIGRSMTSVRRIVERAGEFVIARKPVFCFSLVLEKKGLQGLFFGDPVTSHRAAAQLSREINIVWTPRRYHRIVAECPKKYDELWTGGKLAYKTQEIVDEGGEIVFYAPDIDRVAPQHPQVEEIGYHSLAYFLGQWEKFKDVELSALAHSTHVAGPGKYENGVETLWAKRIIASGISRARCDAMSLGYMDPGAISFAEKKPFGDGDDTLWVPQAGEQLFMPESMRPELEG
ncbi:MAG: lactate racemase domain-containing protein [Bryobacteraceae bacterium]